MNEQTLNWKQAAIAWGEGKEIEVLDNNFNVWLKFGTERQLFFIKDMNYRIKPQAEDENPRYTWCSGSIYKNSMEISFHDVCENLNFLHEDNKALENKLEWTDSYLSSICKQRDEYHYKIESLNQELSQVKEERDSYMKIAKVLHKKDPNNNPSTPAENTDNIPHSFASLNTRIERVENKLLQHGIY